MLVGLFVVVALLSFMVLLWYCSVNSVDMSILICKQLFVCACLLSR